MDVDEDEEEGDQHRHPAGDHLGVDQEADPGDDDEQSRREVVGDDVEAHLAGEDDLEAGGAVVHPDGHVVGVLRPEGLEVDPIVEDGLDDGVLGHHCILKLDLAHWIVEAAHPKFAHLEKRQLDSCPTIFLWLKSHILGSNGVWWYISFSRIHLLLHDVSRERDR